MSMKRVIWILVLLALTVSLAGCWTSQTQEAELSPTMPAEVEITPPAATPTPTPEPTAEPTPSPTPEPEVELTEEDLAFAVQFSDVYLLQREVAADASQEEGADLLGLSYTFSLLDDSVVRMITVDESGVDVTVPGDYHVTYVITVDLDAYDTALLNSVEKTITTMSVVEAANVRSGPGTGYGVMGSFSAGTVVIVDGYENGWYRVYYDGRNGYIMESYLAPIEHETQAQQYTYAEDDELVTVEITKSVHVSDETEYAVAQTTGLIAPVAEGVAVMTGG